MLKFGWWAPAVAGALACFSSSAQFADTVISYSPGSGVNVGYTDPSRALGAPVTYIGYQNADPFNPPYQSSDLVGVGAGGSLTLKFNTPILNDPSHLFGLDFIIFGHAGFMITNGNYSGGGITDGSLFTGGTSSTRVSVSADGVTYYTLDPARALAVDGLFPTDANGSYFKPVNPALQSSSFAGKDLAGLRALDDGSGGGAGYDIAWAQDGSGQSVALASVQFIRIDDLSGEAYIDALSAVPEPTASVLAIFGAAGLWLVRRARISGLSGSQKGFGKPRG